MGYIEKLFNSFGKEPPVISYIEEEELLPNIDISESADAYQVIVRVPDLNPDNVYIEVNQEQLILRGEKNVAKEEVHPNYHIHERSSVYFNHTIFLSHKIDEEKVEAMMENGIINVNLRKLTAHDFMVKQSNKKQRIKNN
jgi:HSP20 family protein